jgi:hypothetical protein
MQKQYLTSLLKNGLIAGVIISGFFLLLYIFNISIYSWMIMFVQSLFQVIVVVTFAFLAISWSRKQNENKRIKYDHAFVISSGVMFLAFLLSYIVSILILYVIDFDYNLSSYKELMQKVADMSNNDAEAMAKMQKGLDDIEHFSIMSVLKSLMFLLIESAVLSVIVALIVKKKDHPEDSLIAQ